MEIAKSVHLNIRMAAFENSESVIPVLFNYIWTDDREPWSPKLALYVSQDVVMNKEEDIEKHFQPGGCFWDHNRYVQQIKLYT